MHELSIAMSIVEMASEEAAARGETSIYAVHLKLGALSGVVKDALLSSYELACEGTVLEGSRLMIEEIPVIVHCAQCRANRSLDPAHWFVCPQCRQPMSEILQGKELQVAALEFRLAEVPA